ncbi:phasin family protein [Piscinibacter sakaiensis]|uniref:Polyhydroxyalkanoate granule-associated protein PhaF n=1 Tax=Piscinibacter sakaiensis TaxID=1547922 RepID=A0A0K8NY17_PISS1|nr:phasin family protein [Piscinibacter sakaiensis]GAP35276.1 polyhydroxyalkanoate granule-associated protein PhaF [Piscinibacter sakaiensis]
MVKKLKQMADKKAAGGASLFDSALAGAVKDSAQQIWLAGMGAFSKAQEEGGKVFEALVKEGVALQRKTQSAAEEKFGEVASRMSNMAGDVGAKAGQQWDKLESIFEERVAKSLGRLGVPSARELEALQARVDALAAEVARLGGRPAAKTPRRAAKKAAAPAPAAAAPLKGKAAKTAKAPKAAGTAKAAAPAPRKTRAAKSAAGAAAPAAA